jgi:hypothetical protein
MTSDPASKLPASLQRQMRATAARWAQRPEQREPPLRSLRDAAAGDILLFPEVPDPRLAWLLLELDGEAIRVVALDSNPLVGGYDLALEEPGLGPWTLRGRFEVRLSRAGSPPTRLGRLGPASLTTARTHCQSLHQGGGLSLLSHEEAESSLAYQDWIEEVVAPGVALLRAHRGAAEPAGATSPAGRSWWLPLRWVAAVAWLLLAAGGTVLLGRKDAEVAALGQAHRAETERLRRSLTELAQARSTVAEQLESERLRAEAARTELEANLTTARRELAQARAATAIRNPLLARLDSGLPLRSGRTQLKLEPGVSHVILVLAVAAPTASRLEVVLRRTGEDKPRFRDANLRVDAQGDLRFGLPASTLSPGAYTLEVRVKDSTGLESLQEHLLLVETISE